MDSRWTDFLASVAAVLPERMTDEVSIRHLGDPGAELQAARDGSIVAPISHLGVLEVTGSDACDFLHGQLSSDVASLAPWQLQASVYCSPKGRVLANSILWREAESFGVLLSRDLVHAISKRLGIFVLRSKVSIADASSKYLMFGVAGPAAATSLSRAFGVVPDTPLSAARTESATLINMGGTRFLVLLEPQAASTMWSKLVIGLTAVGEDAWRWLDIRAGIPWISASTQDQFVPQMANLELIGAVNFHKGCYPGQEIVARTQYLGKLKRRLYRCHVAIGAPPEAATNLYCANLAGESCGTVVNAAPSPGGGCDLLAVMQVEAAQTSSVSPVRLGTIDGPRLEILELPYRIPQAA